MKNGMGCTFMAKPMIDKSGSSFHCHISLYDKLTGDNIFAGNDTITVRKTKFSSNLIYFIGGILKYIEEFFIIFAPFINSYKRFKKNSFAPYYINTWSVENRFATVRICGDEKNPHLEVRISSADANPYLVYATIIQLGLEGMKNKTLPPEVSVGNVYQATDRIAAPANLLIATTKFEKSEMARKIFGNDFCTYLANFSYNEWNLYEDHVSNYEINRYINIV